MDFVFLSKTALFRGTAPGEAEEMLGCLGALTREFGRGEQVLRRGDPVRALGMVLTGSVLIQSDDVWGNTTVLDSVGPGQIFAETYACAPGEPLINSQMGMYELLKDDWTGGRPAAADAAQAAEHVPVQAKVVVRPAAPAAPAVPAAPAAPAAKPAPQPVPAADPKPAETVEAPKPAETVVVVKEQPQGGLFSRLRRALFGGRN